MTQLFTHALKQAIRYSLRWPTVYYKCAAQTAETIIEFWKSKMRSINKKNNQFFDYWLTSLTQRHTIISTVMTTVKQTNSKHYKTHFVVFIFFWILQHTNKDIHQCTQQKANHIIQNFNQQFAHARAQTHTHTHVLRPSGLCLGLPEWAGTRTIWILLKQGTVSGSGISWAIRKSAPCPRQITTPAPHHSVFYRLDDLPATQSTVSKHWRQSA